MGLEQLFKLFKTVTQP